MKNKINKIFKLLLLISPIFFIRASLDNDIWFILSSGRYIFEHGFTTIEPFTVHSNLAFTFEKWLTYVSYYSAYKYLGYAGVLSIVYFVAIIYEILFYKTISYLSENKTNNIIVTFAICSLLNFVGMVTRPQIFSFVLLLIEFNLTEHYARENKIKYLIPLPFVSLIYMQFHSTMWPMFFVMLMPYIFEFNVFSNITGSPHAHYKKLPLLITCVASILTGFINPNGVKSVTYLIRYVLNAPDFPNFVSELQPTTIKFALFLAIPLSVHFIYYAKGKRPPLRYIYFTLGTIILSIIAVRNTVYCLIYTGLISAYMMKDYTFKLSDQAKFVSKTVISGFLVFMIAMSVPNEVSFSPTPCKELLDKFNKEVKSAKLYTDYNTGSYAQWLGYKIYVNPQYEIFMKCINQKEDIIKEYYGVEKGYTSYKKIQEKYNFDYFLVGRNHYLYLMLEESEDFDLYMQDDNYAIFKKGE